MNSKPQSHIMPKSHQLILFFTLLCIYVKAYTFSKANITREWSVKTETTDVLITVIGVNNRLVYKWLTCNPDLKITLKSIEIGVTPCEIPVLHEYNCIHDLVTVALGNGKILVWFRDYDGSDKRCWRHYLVDSQTCLYDAYRINEFSENKADVILPYHNKFDAFFANSSFCDKGNICVLRYNDKGVNILNFTIPHDGDSVYNVTSVKLEDSADGYLYIPVSNNTKSIVKLLNSNYEEVIKQEFNHTIDAFSTTHGSINVCHYVAEKNQLGCEFLEAQLNPKSVVLIPVEDEIRSIEMFNLEDGGSIVLTVSGNRSDYVVNARYIKESDSEVSEPVQLGIYNCNDTLNVEHFQLRDVVHCITVLCNDSDVITTKCITPSSVKYLAVLNDRSL